MMDHKVLDHLARHLIAQHGVQASRVAAMKAEEKLAAGGLEGFDDWMRIGRMIEDIQANMGAKTL